MKKRMTNPRNRDLHFDRSIWNPLYLQMRFCVDAVEDFFQRLPTGRKLFIYDFGCGQKPYAIFADKHVYIGIDIDQTNTNADIHADISSVPVADETADIVTSYCVLEHVENPQQVINEKYRILKNNGSLFMLVPLCWEEHEQPYDFYRYTRYGLRYLLENAGFKDIDISEVNTTPAIFGMYLARGFNRRIHVLVPLVNILFGLLQSESLKRARKKSITYSNVMTFKVNARK